MSNTSTVETVEKKSVFTTTVKVAFGVTAVALVGAAWYFGVFNSSTAEVVAETIADNTDLGIEVISDVATEVV